MGWSAVLNELNAYLRGKSLPGNDLGKKYAIRNALVGSPVGLFFDLGTVLAMLGRAFSGRCWVWGWATLAVVAVRTVMRRKVKSNRRPTKTQPNAIWPVKDPRTGCEC